MMESRTGHEYALHPVLCLELLDSVLIDIDTSWRIEKKIVLDCPLDLFYLLPCELPIKIMLGSWLVLFIGTLVLLKMIVNRVELFIDKLRIWLSKMELHFAAEPL